MKTEELKEVLDYCPTTGVFTWKVKTSVRTAAGAHANATRPNGYVYISIKYTSYMAHRLAFLFMTGAFPKHHVDHINGIRNDNSWANLREVTQQENSRNSAKSIRNKSGVPGVFWYAPTQKWQVHITVAGTKKKHLGYYTDYDEAVSVRKAAEMAHEYHPNHGRIPVITY